MKFKNLSVLIPLFFSSMALSLHGYLGLFNRYLADDFCSAYQAHRLGILRAAWFWYLNWSGRFSASILDATVGSFPPSLVRCVVALTILLWLIVLTAFFIYVLEPRDNKFLISLTLACVTLFTLFLLAPDIRQSLYWGQGMRSVIPPLMLGTIQLMLWKYVNSKIWSNLQIVVWAVFSFFVALVAGGFSETYAAFQVAALFCALFVLLLLKNLKFSASIWFTATALAGAICALILILLAPGNAERQVFYPTHPGIVGILTISLRSCLTYLLHLFDSPAKVFAMVGLFGVAVMAGKQVEHQLNARLLIPTVLFMLAFIYVCFPPAAYGLSDAPPPRTQMLPTYFFLAGIIALGVVCGSVWAQQTNHFANVVLPVVASIAIIVAASMNSIHLYQSRSEFIQYANAWDRTEASIFAAKQNGADKVLIPIIPNWAELNTPNDNPKFWVNICLSGYYDIQIIAKPNVSSQ